MKGPSLASLQLPLSNGFNRVNSLSAASLPAPRGQEGKFTFNIGHE